MHCGNTVWITERSGFRIRFIAGHCPGDYPVIAGFDVLDKETIQFIQAEPEEAIKILLDVADNAQSIRAYHDYEERMGYPSWGDEECAGGLREFSREEIQEHIGNLMALKQCKYHGDEHFDRLVAQADKFIKNLSTYGRLYPPKAKRRQKRKPKSKKERCGFVYLLLLKCTGHYKIGRSSNPDRRVWEEIRPALPEKPDLTCVVATKDMYALEAALHKRFADKRANGEWFLLDNEDVEYIKGLANA